MMALSRKEYNMSQSKEIMALLQDITIQLDKGLKKYYQENELSIPQLTVVTLLSKNDQLKISDISKEMKVSAAAVSGIIDRLEKSGIVCRMRSELDKRIVHVKLTDKFKNSHQHLDMNLTGYLHLLLREQESTRVNDLINSLRFLKETLDNGDNYLEAHIKKNNR